MRSDSASKEKPYYTILVSHPTEGVPDLNFQLHPRHIM